MRDAGLDRLAGADLVLSILPPAKALATATWLAPALRAAPRKPAYADCNAISPETAPAGRRRWWRRRVRTFLDGGIIGGPAREDGYTPVLYVSGPEAARIAPEPLRDHGLDVQVTPGPIGAASALKMSYAGITKGLVALASAMMLAADRGGAAEGLQAELARSQPELSCLVPHAWSRPCRTRPTAGWAGWRRSPISPARRRRTSTARSAGFYEHDGRRPGRAAREGRRSAGRLPEAGLERTAGEPRIGHPPPRPEGRAAQRHGPNPRARFSSSPSAQARAWSMLAQAESRTISAACPPTTASGGKRL